MRGSSARVTVAAFFGVALLPLALWTVDAENAVYPLEPFPTSLSRKTPRDLEQWFESRLGFRMTRMRIGALAQFGVLRRSHSPWVTIGTDRWIFLADHVEDGRVRMSDFRGADRFGEAAVAGFNRVFAAERHAASRCGFAYTFMVAPNKQTIYGEHLARSGWPARTRYTDLLERLTLDARAVVADVQPPLLALKAQRPELLYNATGSHWTELGAWAAYHHLVGVLAGQAAIAEPERSELSRFDVVSTPTDGENADALVIFAREFFSDFDVRLASREPQRIDVRTVPKFRGIYRVTEFTNPDGKGTLLFLGDSFSERIAPFFARHYARVVVVRFNYLARELIETYRPTAVVREVVERQLNLYDRWVEDPATLCPASP